MRLSLSVAARTRAFAKAVRRVRPSFDTLFSAFDSVKLTDPLYDAVLVGLTDEKDDDHFETIPNPDGFFQVLIGCAAPAVNTVEAERQFTKVVFSKLKRAVAACPFSEPDRQKFAVLLDEWERQNL